MATTEMRFSELSAAAILSDDDILALSKVDQTSASGYMSYKATMIAIGLYITKLANYTSDLQTTDKTIIGAINELKQLIALIPQFDIEVVEELPTEDISETTIYMVPSENPETENAYDEFIYVDEEWEQVGSTAVDLSAYYTKLEVNGLLDLKESKADMEDDVTEILKDLSDDVTVTGNPVTFETINGGIAKSCEVTMNPVQDLHGQSSPYPAGGGKNKLPLTVDNIKAINGGSSSWSGNSKVINNVTFTILTDTDNNIIGIKVNGTASIQADFYTINGTTLPPNTYILNGCPSGGSSTTFMLYNQVSGNSDYGEGSQFTISDGSQSQSNRIVIRSGYNAQNLVFKPMIRLSTESDSSFAPYSNICPISGRDSVDVVVTGANQWDEEWELGTYNIITGEKSASASNIRSKNKIPVFQGKTYRFVIPTGITMRYLLYNKDESYSGLTGTKTNGGTLEIPSDIGFMAFHLSEGTTYNNDISINYPSTVTTYNAYHGQTKTITFPSTIYGGTHEIVSGEGTSAYNFKEYNGTENWSLVTGTNPYFRLYIADVTVANTIISSQYPSTEIVPGNTNLGVGNTSGSVRFRLSPMPTLEEFKAMLTDNPVQVCYELATPTPFSTEPTPIKLNKGINVVSTDGDKFYLTYTADIKSYIDGKLAELQS